MVVPVQNFYQDLAKIDDILQRLQRSRQDLAMMFVSSWISVRSQQDFLHLAEIGKISLRLARSRQDCQYTEQFLAMGKNWAVNEDKPFQDIRTEVKL